MDLLNLCFSGLNNDNLIELSIGGTDREHRRWIPIRAIDALKIPEQLDVYFGPAVRAKADAIGKANCLGSQVLWVDLDRPDLIPAVLPPSAIVRSGHGYHLYWRIDTFIPERKEIETRNASLAQSVKGDSCHNIDRLMRLPGSMNMKESDAPIVVSVDIIRPEYVYSLGDVDASLAITDKMARKVRNGDRRGYTSRSERDWAIVTALVSAGMSDESITRIFDCHKCGDKHQSERGHYLDKTIASARESSAEVITIRTKAGDGGSEDQAGPGPVVEKDNCYYMASGRGAAQVSTFVLDPLLLLEGDEDAIVADVRANGTKHVWKGEVFTKTELSSLGKLTPRLNKAAWNWLGRDLHVRQMSAYLIQQLQAKGVPLARSTRTMGRHSIVDDDRTYYVTREAVIGSDGSIWKGDSRAPIVYVPATKNLPSISITDSHLSQEVKEVIAENLPNLHDPDAIWPMIGWYAATPLKPAIEEAGYRFPILSVSGTKGSGKTTLIQRIFLRMAGYTDPKGYDANTTRFVLLSLLGSSNAPPISFSEFRANMTKEFLRYILLSYDSGVDARGRPDQTITQYPLTAPFSIDGEDQLQDPAVKERIVAVHLKKDTVMKDSPAWRAFQRLSAVDLHSLSLPYALHTLQIGGVREGLIDAQKEVDKAFVYPMPDRVRRNLAVAWYGIDILADFLGTPRPPIQVMRQALENVYVVARGRAPVAADDFVEFVVNIAARGSANFSYKLKDGVLWFHVTPAYHAYASHSHRMGQPSLSKAAMVSMLEEMTRFVLPAQVMKLEGKMVRAHGIDLQAAYDAELDIPSEITTKEFTLTIRG